jgi:bifunctional DNA-binding transcriptional regulator/antitoxin component of YhaV-PrlF toxin-antitoxin module
MAIRKIQQESLVHVDNKGRVVLPREVRRSGLYAVEMTANDEIILRPRVAVDPREVINKRTLDVLDESMQNLLKGKAGEPINLSAFGDEGAAKGGRDEQKITSRQKKLRRK